MKDQEKELNSKPAQTSSENAVEANSDSQAGLSTPSPDLNDRELEGAVYQNDPRFQELLSNFQKAEWKECLKKIDDLLAEYPADKALLVFKQDAEVRLERENDRQQQLNRERHGKRKKIAIRVATIVVIGLLLLVLAIWMGNIYQANLTQARLEKQVALTVEALNAQVQTADTFMRANNPEEALRLYREIQQTNPSYAGIAQKIQAANQAIIVEGLYQQATQAMNSGQTDEALTLLQKIDALQPKYKDVPMLIEKIQQGKQISSLTAEIGAAYSQGNWQGVIDDYQAIQNIDPGIELPELNDALFNSYEKMITDIASRPNLTLQDIETANNYYRDAMALFPQNKNYAQQRADLQKVAVGILANKYYLQGMDLLKSSNYSINGLEQAVNLLKSANSTGFNSPAINVETEKAQLFLDGYNALLQNNWNDAIDNFEILRQREENYGNGRVKYFLYEAYVARGDIYFANGNFDQAFSDYQAAEVFGWGSTSNLTRLFEIETRIASVLNKLGEDKDAAEFYHYIFNRLNYQTQLTGSEDKNLLDTLNAAEAIYNTEDKAGAIHLYQTAMSETDKFYTTTRISVAQGDNLANIAFNNGSTVESLRTANQLSQDLLIEENQTLIIPVISINNQ